MMTTQADKTLFEQAFAASPDGILIVATQTNHYSIMYCNPSFASMVDQPATVIIRKSFDLLVEDTWDKAGLPEIYSLLERRQTGKVILRNIQKEGGVFWHELRMSPIYNTASSTHFIITITDITDHKLLETQLLHRATHDQLTRLPNRELLLERLDQAIITAKRSDLKVAILFFDIDRFKFFNDFLSHKAGDEILKIIAQRATECFRSTDTVARISGDEFAVILPALHDANITHLITKLQQALAVEFNIEENSLAVKASIGISLYPQDGTDVETLLKKADIAMFWAKETGRNNFQFYHSEMDANNKNNLKFENHLRHALGNRELILYYQPILELKTGKIIAAEALLRWQHPELGLLSPNEFLIIAEKIGLMSSLGQWVIHTACQQNKAWQQQGLPFIKMAVNVSGEQFKARDFVADVTQTLAEIELDPAYLELELSEKIVIHDQKLFVPQLRELKNAGVSIVIDDFGSAYSTLGSIKYLPADKLKIDQGFIQNLHSDPSDAVIVTAIIGIAKKLNLQVVAEGVEKISQLEFLEKHQCHQVQGFYYSPPIPANHFAELLQSSQWQKRLF